MWSWTRQVSDKVAIPLLHRSLRGFWEKTGFWSLPITVFNFLALWLPSPWDDWAALLLLFSVPLLLCAAVVLSYRFVTRRLLWAVRNRIIVTCLLMGLAPMVLFGSLTSIAAYVFCGQFATNSAMATIDTELEQVRDRVAMYGSPAAHALERDPDSSISSLPTPALTVKPDRLEQQMTIAAWQDGAPLRVEAMQRDHAPQPAPLQEHPPRLRPGFSGVVQQGEKLFLEAVAGYQSPQHNVIVVVSVPLSSTELAKVGDRLGVVRLMPRHNEEGNRNDAEPVFRQVQGGTLPPPLHFFDNRVFFTAPMTFTDAATGAPVPAFIGVVSRPTILYGKLFSTSVQIGDIVRDVLLTMTVLFGLLQLLAIYMAIRLSRSITRSVASLYHATTEIDSGNLAHRIPVHRADQLASLATSFNTMAGSLGELLDAQREQQRMQSELAIAQEVQRNLFPHAPVGLPGFELHGLCKPARTVSGDYFDFILSPINESAQSDGTPSGAPQIFLAIGDISGKGISAALLMASLHSAVRAYSVPGDGSASAVPSPSAMLEMLNRHLYSSTQPEKYATLFLATYCSDTQELVYANGGQLPPFVISADGSCHALRHGGSVVGLLDGLSYEQGSVRLKSGDLLVAYSDGVTEPENEFGEFGEERLLALMRKYHDQPLHAIAAHTMRELSSWIGDAEQPDDITLVLARQA